MAKDERSSLISRVGTFFMLLGFLGVILFVASDAAQNTNFLYLLLAIILLVAAFFLKRNNQGPTQPNKRFEGVRKLQQSRREAAAKNEKNKKNPTR